MRGCIHFALEFVCASTFTKHEAGAMVVVDQIYLDGPCKDTAA